MDSEPSLAAVAPRLRAVADAVLAEYGPQAGADPQTKADGSVVTQVDLQIQQRMQAALAQDWPYPLLGEEHSPQQQRALLEQDATPVWCLDPLDGTTNFAAGLPFVSVSLALLAQGRAVAGWVYDPWRRECFSARRGAGAWLNDSALRVPVLDTNLAACVANVDLKRLPADLAVRLVQGPPYRSQRNFGSCALEWAWLAAGRLQLYLHGGMKLWDYAAGQLILAEAGGAACTLAGEAVPARVLTPRSVVASPDAGLLAAWCAYLGVPETAP